MANGLLHRNRARAELQTVSPNPLPFTVGSSPVAWMLGILGLLVWMAFRPHGDYVPKIFLLIVVFWATGPACLAALNKESAGFPLKFDNFLYLVDQALGLSAFAVARFFTEWQRSVLFQIYQSLTMAMTAWYGINLRARDGRPSKLLLAYAVAFLVGPCLYLILPALGPRHAFGAAFPMGDPVVAPVLVRLAGWPNAIPSLHVSTALLLVFFSGRNRIVRSLAWIYLIGTVAATLAFEHYMIDLVVAVPFACSVTQAVEIRMRRAAGNLILVLGWMLAIRYAFPWLVACPMALRVAALATVVIPAAGMVERRRPIGGRFSLPKVSRAAAIESQST